MRSVADFVHIATMPVGFIVTHHVSCHVVPAKNAIPNLPSTTSAQGITRQRWAAS
jgi:hypothetical protein